MGACLPVSWWQPRKKILHLGTPLLYGLFRSWSRNSWWVDDLVKNFVIPQTSFIGKGDRFRSAAVNRAPPWSSSPSFYNHLPALLAVSTRWWRFLTQGYLNSRVSDLTPLPPDHNPPHFWLDYFLPPAYRLWAPRNLRPFFSWFPHLTWPHCHPNVPFFNWKTFSKRNTILSF